MNVYELTLQGNEITNRIYLVADEGIIRTYVDGDKFQRGNSEDYAWSFPEGKVNVSLNRLRGDRCREVLDKIARLDFNVRGDKMKGLEEWIKGFPNPDNTIINIGPDAYSPNQIVEEIRKRTHQGREFAEMLGLVMPQI